MPAIYVSGAFEDAITFENKDYPYSDWIDKKLAKQREEYKKSNLMLWLEIENKNEPISPFAIPVGNLDVYEGTFDCKQAGMTFTVQFNGKAKVNVTKETKAAVDAGEKSMAVSLSVNGAGKSFDKPTQHKLVVQSKKV